MQAIQIKEPELVQVVEKEKPQVGNDEVLLKLKYVGFCGSDLSTYLGKNPMVKYPRVPGHEISAVIESVGCNVPDNLKAGMFVTVVPYTNCGQCPSCKNGRQHACQFNQTLGVQRDGAMSEFIAVPWQKVLVAEGLTEKELAMVEPLTVGFHATERGRVTDSDVVLVFGCGMIGVGAIVRSVLRGATVIAVDIDDDKLEVARQLGVQYTINSLKEDLHKQLESIVPAGPDVIIEAAGNPKTYLAAVNEVAFTGRVVCIGYAKDDVSFATKLFVQKEMDIMGSRNATASDFRAVISYLQRKTFPIDKMITRIIKVDEASDGMKQWADAPGKVFKILVEF
ncbi:MAG: zinc-binding alcohol dehydrogenase family protein [Marinilabiliaceae bacterium]|nr:zinc-binding alcohol dehydrogenase family protein [Marinilabiliaceae bacterium]